MIEIFWDQNFEGISRGTVLTARGGLAMEWLDPVAFARERLQFEPDDKQELALRGGRRGIVLCTRQWGKSTVMAAKAVHRAYTQPGSLILLLSPCGRQSAEFLRKATG